MASKFECEVRFEIKDIDGHVKKLKELNGTLKYSYEFTDYYYEPKSGKWNPTEKSLRIREWKNPQKPTQIFFVKNEIISSGGIEFKRALYEEGKVPLYTGDAALCRSLLDDLEFKEWLVVKKEKADFWSLPEQEFDTVYEYIDGVGWSGELEFEGENPDDAREKIKKALEVLGIAPELVSFKPVAAITAEKRGII